MALHDKTLNYINQTFSRYNNDNSSVYDNLPNNFYDLNVDNQLVWLSDHDYGHIVPQSLFPDKISAPDNWVWQEHIDNVQNGTNVLDADKLAEIAEENYSSVESLLATQDITDTIENIDIPLGLDIADINSSIEFINISDASDAVEGGLDITDSLEIVDGLDVVDVFNILGVTSILSIGLRVYNDTSNRHFTQKIGKATFQSVTAPVRMVYNLTDYIFDFSGKRKREREEQERKERQVVSFNHSLDVLNEEIACSNEIFKKNQRMNKAKMILLNLKLQSYLKLCKKYNSKIDLNVVRAFGVLIKQVSILYNNANDELAKFNNEIQKLKNLFSVGPYEFKSYRAKCVMDKLTMHTVKIETLSKKVYKVDTDSVDTQIKSTLSYQLDKIFTETRKDLQEFKLVKQVDYLYA
ncbi:hypothetical protein [Flammeovirga kamogawensis]|uniref:Uncharacterized protein n=1 Tax=Flammeovirga kamogawensis TaxID=373891 RepID=A0ABX8H4Z8_9BACT|nr:hypothetical protein [Flammeovirga kamogawensis]MBB6461793.1 hypothetical protein [Flammeovirga kamogawensis]QWG10709.1 hypothetical protein KM029_25330 [Flammeovirga kamogawensis]TRX63811.1 hypothetical protein EO216_25700 [Flammeovirga kamogawensis]